MSLPAKSRAAKSRAAKSHIKASSSHGRDMSTKSGNGVPMSQSEVSKSLVGKPPCMFLCDRMPTYPDEESQEPDALMRWAYAIGDGCSCWYCERVYKVKCAHKPTKNDLTEEMQKGQRCLPRVPELSCWFHCTAESGLHTRLRPGGWCETCHC